MVVESRLVIRKAKNERGLGRDRAATAPFPKSCASYFRFARFNTFPLHYLRAWHRLLKLVVAFPTNQQVWQCKRNHVSDLKRSNIDIYAQQ